jgi:hypothetical protein
MPRVRRWQLDGDFHHIVVKGHDGDPIVSSADEADELLDRLGRAFREERLVATSVAFLTTHGHIEGVGRIEAFSRAIRSTLGPFAQTRNLRLSRSGAMFTNRFWSEPIVDDGHAVNTPPYILLNARKAGLVHSVPALRGYRWCSYGHTFHGDSFPVPIDLDVLFGRYAEDADLARKILRETLDAGEARWLEDLRMKTVEAIIRVVAANRGVPENLIRRGDATRWVSAARCDIVLEVRRRRLPVAAETLARELGVSPRTIWRMWRRLPAD